MESLFETIARMLGPKSHEKLTISPRRRLFGANSTALGISTLVVSTLEVPMVDTLQVDSAIFIEMWTGSLTVDAVANTGNFEGITFEIDNQTPAPVVWVGEAEMTVTPLISSAAAGPRTSFQVKPAQALLTFFDFAQWANQRAIALTQPLQFGLTVAYNNGAAASHMALQSQVAYRFISGIAEG